jgi:PAS domain S-box-containing protein
VSALGNVLGGPCALRAQEGNAPPRWTLGRPDGLHRVALERLGRRLGWLAVPPGTDTRTLEPLLPTAAALLLKDAETDAPPSHSGHAALLHAALAGADTFVWEWDIDNDWLSDIDEGLSLLGYGPHQTEHTQAGWNRLIHADDRAANHEAYLRHERGEVETYEHAYRALAADGSWRWLLERGRIVERHPDGRPRRMLGTQTDITARRAIEAAASETTERLGRIAMHVPGLLFQYRRITDNTAVFPYASERSLPLFGVRPDELMRDASALMRRVDFADRQAMIDSIAASAATLAPWRLDFRVRRRDGVTRWIRGEASPMRLPDGATVWHGYMEDATERRELEQARQDAAVAAAANRAKTQFLSRMSHELRTPLNAVLGFTQLIEIDQAEPPTAGQRRRLKLVREAGEHLLQMIGDLLDLTRIESGGMALQFDAVDLQTVAGEALEMLRAAAEKAQVAVTLVPTGDAPLARADRTRLRQVLLNLLSNAIKYNRPGGSVLISVQRVDDHEVRLSVRDTGVGIEESELPRVFEAFYRGPLVSTTVEGAGIGLSVTQALVTLMGGRIEVQSRAGAGSTFSVTLPGA